MITLGELEKEFDKLFEYEDMNGDCSCNKYEVRKFILKVIDEMIGEKKKEESKLPEMGDEYIKVERENIGYNQKRAELKKYKEEFNK